MALDSYRGLKFFITIGYLGFNLGLTWLLTIRC
jgi:hypothetical protein